MSKANPIQVFQIAAALIPALLLAGPVRELFGPPKQDSPPAWRARHPFIARVLVAFGSVNVLLAELAAINGRSATR